MSRGILVMGESGSGKTTSLRTLNPQETFIIESDGKGLSWRGWKKQYSKENKNYFETYDAGIIKTVLDRIDTEMPHVKVIVIDTLNMIMVNDEMNRMRERGYDKWVDLATCIWGIIDQWIDAVVNGKPSPFTIDEAVMLTRLMDGAYKAFETGAKATF